MPLKCDVAIVGGGIGGLTLASSLSRQSISVQVFEQSTEMREIGAGVAISGNATRLLTDLGIDLMRVANVPPALEVRRWNDGGLLWSHPIGAWYQREAGSPFLTIHRATLQRLLAGAVPTECLRLNHRLVGLSDARAGVRLRFEQGEDVIARVVAGVDGVHSMTRRYVCGDIEVRYSGEVGFRGVIPLDKLRGLPNPNSLHIWCGPRTHAVFYGLDGGKSVNLLAVYQPAHLPKWTASSNRLAASREEALEVFQNYRWDPRILDLIRNIEGDVSFWALQDLPRLPRWSRGRVTLLGDAAHAPLPHQGQGAGQTIEDAYALGALLGADMLENYASVFTAFENLRRRRTRRVQAYSRIAGRAFKFVDSAAAKRDGCWSRLPQRIAWIHAYRAEEAVAALTKRLPDENLSR